MQLGRRHQCVHDGTVVPAGDPAGEQMILTPQSNRTDGALDDVIVELKPAVAGDGNLQVILSIVTCLEALNLAIQCRKFRRSPFRQTHIELF